MLLPKSFSWLVLVRGRLLEEYGDNAKHQSDVPVPGTGKVTSLKNAIKLVFSTIWICIYVAKHSAIKLRPFKTLFIENIVRGKWYT